MMKGSLAIILMGVCAAAVEGCTSTIEGKKCDPAIEAKIKALRGNSTNHPVDVSIANGKVVVVGTSKGYYPPNIKCLLSFFTKNGFTSVRIMEEGCPVILDCAMTAVPGGIIEPGSNTRRLYVFDEDGVMAFYKCNNDGPEGDPEGVINVSESTKDHSALITKAKGVLAGLGIDIVVEYPSACP